MNGAATAPIDETETFDAVRRAMAPAARSSTATGLAIVAVDVTLYLLAAAGLVTASSMAARALLGVLLGVAAALLFTVGHDACHGSFTASARLNGLIGRIAFLPSYTPFTSWAYAHNSVHHRYTNLRTKDYVWAPLTKAEYDSLPQWRQAVERWYRSLAGFGPYYAVEIWWKRLMFPADGDVPRREALFRRDRLLVIGFAAAEAAAIWALAARHGGHPLSAVLCGVALRFLVWNHMMGLVIFQHHTHPEITWFDDARKWRYAQAQLSNTVHVVFPRPVNFLLHRIMEHNAHHVDVRIPMYRLQRAQEMAERADAAGILVQAWSPRVLLWCLRTCQLYDFKRNAWLSFEGEVTSAAPARRAVLVQSMSSGG